MMASSLTTTANNLMMSTATKTTGTGESATASATAATAALGRNGAESNAATALAAQQAAQQPSADDSAISFSDDDEDDDEDNVGSTAFNAAAAAAAFQRQIFANFPLFQQQQQQQQETGQTDSNPVNPFEQYIAAAAAAAAAANAEALIRQQLVLQQQSGEKRPANDSGTDDNDPIHHAAQHSGGNQPGNKRRKQSKPVRIASDGSEDNSAAVTAFLAQTAAILQQQQQQQQQQSMDEEEGLLVRRPSSSGLNESEQEEGQIIRNSLGLVDQSKLLSHPARLLEMFGSGKAPFYVGWNGLDGEQSRASSNSPEDGLMSDPKGKHFNEPGLLSDSFFNPYGNGKYSPAAFPPGFPSPPFLYPFGLSGQQQQQQQQRSSSAGLRIFNHEAYCELCNKEFCNKYFLKTHKANKHGIYDGTMPAPPPPTSSSAAATSTSSSPSTPTVTMAPIVSSAAPTVSASFGPPLSLTVGALSYPMHPPETRETTNYSPAPVASSKPAASTASSQSALMDFFPLWTTPPSVPTSSSMPSIVQHGNSGGIGKTGGIINPEAYCDLCQKEFCNKYFLKRHKAKMHGITPPDPPTSTASNGQSTTPSSGGGSHKKKSSASKAVPPPQQQLTPTGPVDLVKIAIPPLQPVIEHQQRPAAMDLIGPAAQEGQHAESAKAPEEVNKSFDLLLGRDSLSLLKIPTFSSSSGPTTPNAKPIQHQQTPLGNNGQQQQLFSPERLRQMGVINTEAFCELCCKEFCNKYFLRTHKFKKHGIGSLPDPPESSNGSAGSNNNKHSPKQVKQHSQSQQPQQQEVEQKAPLNLASSTSPPAGELLSCDQCQRPFQSAYLLHMHRTYFHNQTDSMEEEDLHQQPQQPPHEQEEDGRTTEAPVKSEKVDDDGVNISADLQKLQSMIMELNGQPPSVQQQQQRNWMTDKPPATGGGINGEITASNLLTSGGGIVKINPGDHHGDSTSTQTVCHLCGNKDFFTPYFLQMHMQNYHGDQPLDGPMLDLSVGTNSSGGKRRSGSASGGGSSGGNSSTRSYCQICNKELCNKYFMKTHMLKMHGIHMEASGGGAQIAGVQCDICHKELCSKYFLKVHKQNTHGIHDPNDELLLPPNGAPNGLPTMAGPKGSSADGVMDLSFHQPMQQMTDSQTKTELCPLCPKRFKSSKSLKAHLSHDHSAAPSSGSTCCYICNQQFADVVQLQVHLIKNHASQLMQPDQTPPPPQQQQQQQQQSERSTPPASGGGGVPNVQQNIQCPLCAQPLALDQFQAHLMDHQLPGNLLHTLQPHPIQRQQAHQHELTGTKKKKKLVMGVHRQRRFKCSACARRFPSRQLCLAHILQRHPPRCKRFNGRNSVVKDDSPSKSLTCPRCGYATRQPQLLRLHLRSQQCIPVLARNPDLQQLPPYLAVPTGGGPVNDGKTAANSQRQDFVLQAFLLSQPQQQSPVEQQQQPDTPPKQVNDESADTSNFIPSLILLPVNRRIANPLSLTFSLTPA